MCPAAHTITAITKPCASATVTRLLGPPYRIAPTPMNESANAPTASTVILRTSSGCMLPPKDRFPESQSLSAAAVGRSRQGGREQDEFMRGYRYLLVVVPIAALIAAA